MKLVLKRIGAYFIDIILVTLLSTLLSANSYINKDYDAYSKTYEEYNNEYDHYIEFYEKVEKYYDDNKISEEEYNKLIDIESEYDSYLNDYYKDKIISEEEYKTLLKNINKNYSEKETNYNYKLLKYSIIPTIVSLMSILLYFVVFQFYFNGQTLGKKLMKIRVISNNNKDLKIFNFFIRSLIVNEVFINILNLVFLIILSKDSFIEYNKIIYAVTYIIEMTILFTIVFNKDNRGLHDYISNTKVIEDKKE